MPSAPASPPAKTRAMREAERQAAARAGGARNTTRARRQPTQPAAPASAGPSSVSRAVESRTARVVAADETVVPEANGGSKHAYVAGERASFLMSFVYAWNGILYAVRTQRNMRVHIAIFVVAVALGVVLHISPVEFAMVFVAATGVFIAEMMNTVAEAVVDLATQEYHPLARIAKDVAAGVVLMNALLSVVIGLFVFLPHLWPLLLLWLRALGW